ncbi:SH3 domain-containing C40 family peptidase [Campylobacter sp. 19-13652]|uniref:SH3 domain-containing C40 family peptidase n=1 Tax=Campylobacter sp. 19-13652 TaxID=2840180 RepID=UPI001C789575|nr:SH3 domain-containing C40 family peptidase [Campylobacter sp. 19-13652]BCX79347.1 lipoprotein [Campylobacter sp. 19-13652]
MKRTIFAILAGFLLVACTSMQAPLEPETPQSSSSLPKINDAMGIDSARLIARRFAPWNIKTIDEKPDSLLWGVNSYKFRAKKPWYGANLKPLKPEFFARLAKNVARDDIGKVSAYAITLRDTALRALPSAAPLFSDPKKAGEGWPFDYLQISALPVGAALFISHYSADGAWALVRDDDVWGWVKASDILELSESEAHAYASSASWLVALKDGEALRDKEGKFIAQSRIGMILPLSYEGENEWTGRMYTEGGLSEFVVSAQAVARYPMVMNDARLAQLTNALLGQAYGWGGLGGLRDCSLFTKDFLAGFGLWLPRNSRAQSAIGERISLKGLSQNQKLELIAKEGVPYRTLVHLPGHIMLYVGLSAQGEPLVLHDVWGLRTKDGGRAILGGINLTTLLVGEDRKDVAKESLLINRADYINILK